uniref:Alternative protein IGF1 n=1 Tax=Homo sapiens TaxID=9606 RepID=L8EC78_HUMAN|nr:alternative protein IGF1 [Homo sapiens]
MSHHTLPMCSLLMYDYMDLKHDPSLLILQLSLMGSFKGKKIQAFLK